MSSPQAPVPPPPSSHTAEGVSTGTHVIRITKLAYLAVFMLFFCVLFPVAGWPALFVWLLLLPAAVLAWVIRSRTTVTSAGVQARTLLGSRDAEWSQIKGLRFPKRGWARADLTEGGELKLPAVTFDRLPELAAASGGRIPDPYAAKARVADSEDIPPHE